MAFLLQVGNHAEKYQYGPRSQTNPFAMAVFDLQGQITRSKCQITSNKGLSETLVHADTFQHDCQLVTKNAIKSFGSKKG